MEPELEVSSDLLCGSLSSDTAERHTYPQPVDCYREVTSILRYASSSAPCRGYVAVALTLWGSAFSCGSCDPAVIREHPLALLPGACRRHSHDISRAEHTQTCTLYSIGRWVPMDIEKLMFSPLSPWQAVEGPSDYTWG